MSCGARFRILLVALLFFILVIIPFHGRTASSFILSSNDGDDEASVEDVDDGSGSNFENVEMTQESEDSDIEDGADDSDDSKEFEDEEVDESGPTMVDVGSLPENSIPRTPREVISRTGAESVIANSSPAVHDGFQALSDAILPIHDAVVPVVDAVRDGFNTDDFEETSRVFIQDTAEAVAPIIGTGAKVAAPFLKVGSKVVAPIIKLGAKVVAPVAKLGAKVVKAKSVAVGIGVGLKTKVKSKLLKPKAVLLKPAVQAAAVVAKAPAVFAGAVASRLGNLLSDAQQGDSDDQEGAPMMLPEDEDQMVEDTPPEVSSEGNEDSMVEDSEDSLGDSPGLPEVDEDPMVTNNVVLAGNLPRPVDVEEELEEVGDDPLQPIVESLRPITDATRGLVDAVQPLVDAVTVQVPTSLNEITEDIADFLAPAAKAAAPVVGFKSKLATPAVKLGSKIIAPAVKLGTKIAKKKVATVFVPVAKVAKKVAAVGNFAKKSIANVAFDQGFSGGFRLRKTEGGPVSFEFGTEAHSQGSLPTFGNDFDREPANAPECELSFGPDGEIAVCPLSDNSLAIPEELVPFDQAVNEDPENASKHSVLAAKDLEDGEMDGHDPTTVFLPEDPGHEINTFDGDGVEDETLTSSSDGETVSVSGEPSAMLGLDGVTLNPEEPDTIVEGDENGEPSPVTLIIGSTGEIIHSMDNDGRSVPLVIVDVDGNVLQNVLDVSERDELTYGKRERRSVEDSPPPPDLLLGSVRKPYAQSFTTYGNGFNEIVTVLEGQPYRPHAQSLRRQYRARDRQSLDSKGKYKKGMKEMKDSPATGSASMSTTEGMKTVGSTTMSTSNVTSTTVSNSTTVSSGTPTAPKPASASAADNNGNKLPGNESDMKTESDEVKATPRVIAPKCDPVLERMTTSMCHRIEEYSITECPDSCMDQETDVRAFINICKKPSKSQMCSFTKEGAFEEEEFGPCKVHSFKFVRFLDNSEYCKKRLKCIVDDRFCQSRG